MTDGWDVVAMADLLSRDGYDGVYARPTSYDVSVWPPEIECMDSDTWKLTVEYRGRGKWAVLRYRACLGSDGEWSWESIPSEREDEWLAAHRFPLAEALDLARRHAPLVKINGMTAAEVLERHRQRHPDGNCAPSMPSLTSGTGNEVTTTPPLRCSHPGCGRC